MAKSSEKFRANVKKLLAAKGWTQKELAEKAGVHPPVISRVLSGKNEPELVTLDAIAQAFGTTAARLLSSEQEGDRPLFIEPSADQILQLIQERLKPKLLKAAEPASSAPRLTSRSRDTSKKGRRK